MCTTAIVFITQTVQRITQFKDFNYIYIYVYKTDKIKHYVCLNVKINLTNNINVILRSNI